jgi:hypothetical protein
MSPLRVSCWSCGEDVKDLSPQGIQEHICKHQYDEFEEKVGAALMESTFCDHYCCGLPPNVCRVKSLAKALRSRL